MQLSTDLKNIRLLAIGGGGAAGVAPIGGAMALSDYGLLDKVEVFTGTSSGAILAAALAFGYRGKELEKVVLDQEFPKIQAFNLKEAAALQSNLKHFGVLSGDPIRYWVGRMAARRLGKRRLTFGELKTYREQAEAKNLEFFEEKFREAKSKEKAFKKTLGEEFYFDFSSAEELMAFAAKTQELHVVASEVIKEKGRQNPMQYRETIFNAENFAEVPIGRAVQASASFPFAFAQMEINGKTYTDGGHTTVTPLNILGKRIPKENCLALKAGERDPGATEPIAPPPPAQGMRKKLGNFVDRLIQAAHIFQYRPGEIPMPEARGIWQKLKRETRRFQMAYRLSFQEGRQADPNKSQLQLLAEAAFGRHHVEAAQAQLTKQEGFLKENQDRIILLDRGNVDEVDFHIGRKEKAWLLESGYKGVEKVLREHGIKQPSESQEQGHTGTPDPSRHINRNGTGRGPRL